MSTTSVPTETQTATETNNPTRNCLVTQDGGGNPLGAGIFLSAEQLQALGVEPDGGERLAYEVIDGEIVFSEL